VGAIATKVLVDFLKAMDEMQHVFSSIRSTCRRAKMGAATEGPILIDQATSGEWVEHRTGPIRRGRQGFPPRGAKSFGNNQSLAPREVGRFSCEAKLAALGTKRARALDG
jgi:hypothetical protein